MADNYNYNHNHTHYDAAEYTSNYDEQNQIENNCFIHNTNDTRTIRYYNVGCVRNESDLPTIVALLILFLLIVNIHQHNYYA